MPVISESSVNLVQWAINRHGYEKTVIIHHIFSSWLAIRKSDTVHKQFHPARNKPEDALKIIRNIRDKAAQVLYPQVIRMWKSTILEPKSNTYTTDQYITTDGAFFSIPKESPLTGRDEWHRQNV